MILRQLDDQLKIGFPSMGIYICIDYLIREEALMDV